MPQSGPAIPPAQSLSSGCPRPATRDRPLAPEPPWSPALAQPITIRHSTGAENLSTRKYFRHAQYARDGGKVHATPGTWPAVARPVAGLLVVRPAPERLGSPRCRRALAPVHRDHWVPRTGL